jgi:hypothetical protein
MQLENENLNISDASDSSIDWDKFAEALMNEHSQKNNPNFVISEGDYDNPYDYLLLNLTISDIIDFIKNYH